MRNEILYAERKKRRMTIEEFANFIGIPKITYHSYETCYRTPRSKHMEVIMNKLDIKDASVFFPKLHIASDTEDVNKSIVKKITEYMNSMSKSKCYDVYEVSMIRRAVRAEYLMRKVKKIKANPKDENRIKEINKAIAEIANGYLKSEKINHKDVELFKKCKLFEYEFRTNGECYE